MLTPHKLREIVFHLLYSSDFSESEQSEIFPFLMEHHKVTKKTLHAADELAQQIRDKMYILDQWISETATDYEFERIPRVERNLLRLALYEIYFSKTVPPKVALSEAIRLARKFATAEGATFVNAVLDALYKKKEHAF